MQTQARSRQPVLIAETDPLIALDLEQRLKEVGFDVVGPVFSHRELDYLAGLPLAAAVLNSGALGPDVSTSLMPLTKSGVPVLLISGYADIGLYLKHEGVKIIPKPADIHDIVDAVREVTATHRASL